MKTKLSTKGQVVLPGPLRRKMGLEPGDELDVSAEQGHLLLIPKKKLSRRPKIVTDQVTGLPVLSIGPDAPRLTGKQVDEALSEFP